MAKKPWGITIFYFLLIGVVMASLGYIIWNSYLGFYDLVIYHRMWDWSSFYCMIFGVFGEGLFLGIIYVLISYIRSILKEEKEYIERQKLKEEIKKELEMKKQEKA